MQQPLPEQDVQDKRREQAILAALQGRSIVLVGMMGVGKSSIGRRLAARLELPFVDADTEIEQAAGMPIPEIFAQHGEPYFRDGEARVIVRLLSGAPLVLATGGGAYMRQATRDIIRQRGVSLWLKADADLILRRVRRRNDRPLLQSGDQLATIERLIAERYPVYADADICILSHDVPHERIVEDCINALFSQLCPASPNKPLTGA